MNHASTKSRVNSGDAAVTGLFSGIAGGLVMILFLMAAGLAAGSAPAVVVGYFDPTRDGNPLPGILAHLAISSVYGVVYGIVWRGLSQTGWKQPPGWMAGMVFGLGLYAIARLAFLTDSSISLFFIPAWQLLTAHLGYGLGLGWVFARSLQHELAN